MRKERIYILFLTILIIIMVWEIVELIRDKYATPIDEIGESNSIENIYENRTTVTTAMEEEKVSPHTSFALKKYYDECRHFDYEEAELPIELVNLTKQEVEDYYDDWEVEELTEDKLVLCKEINGYCNQHFLIRLDDQNVNVYRLGTLGEWNTYRKTDIARDYLPEEDVASLEEGITVYGEGKLSAALEDYE